MITALKEMINYLCLTILNKSFKNAKTITHRGNKKTKFRLRGLRKGKKYYIRYAPFRKSNGKVYYGIQRERKI